MLNDNLYVAYYSPNLNYDQIEMLYEINSYWNYLCYLLMNIIEYLKFWKKYKNIVDNINHNKLRRRQKVFKLYQSLRNNGALSYYLTDIRQFNNYPLLVFQFNNNSCELIRSA